MIKKIKTSFFDLLARTDGQSMTEYALATALVILAALGAEKLFENAFAGAFKVLMTSLSLLDLIDLKGYLGF